MPIDQTNTQRFPHQTKTNMSMKIENTITMDNCFSTAELVVEGMRESLSSSGDELRFTNLAATSHNNSKIERVSLQVAFP
jgi:hypothetical protein